MINGTREIAVLVITALRGSAIPPSVRRRADGILFKTFTIENVASAVRDALR